MNKKLILAMALILVLAFATGAMAAQVMVAPAVSGGPNTFISTSPSAGMDVYNTADNKTEFKRVYADNKFKADGITNYPYEIYLPNEKNTNAYRIHSNYTKNTDACASCHSTHTAVGANLLQWYSVYETCMACHDGTVTTTYDVQSGKIGTTGKPTFGGMFGNGLGSESSHNVTGAMSIAAAPGGSVVETSVQVGHDNQKLWTPEFGCESCHTPHGLGGNARLLHPDANYFATDRATKKGWFGMINNGDGKGLVVNPAKSGITFNVYGEDVSGKVYFAYVEPAGTVGAGVYNSGNGLSILTGYPYSTIIKIAGTNITAAYRKDFVIDNTLGYSRVIYTGTDASVMVASYASKVVVIGVPSVKVTMQINNYLGFANTTEQTASLTEAVYHKDGMNVFCGTCHTDYNTMSDENWVADPITGAMKFSKSDQKDTGVYSKAHRHQMGFNWYTATGGLAFETGYRMECLTCHVAHGTSTDYWNRTLVTNVGGPVIGPDGTAWTAGSNNANLQELAGSSALKRMPNMGTCEACHAMENGNQGYAANTGAGVGVTPVVENPVLQFPFFLGDSTTTSLKFVGSDKCAGCHKDIYDKWFATATQNHGHAATTSLKSLTSYPNGTCGDAPNTVTGLGYATAGCHAIGYTLTKNDPNQPSTFALNGKDAGVTCEVCHNSGAQHILAPSNKNIFNPGNASVGNLDRFNTSVLGCVKCHGSVNNNGSDMIHLSNTSTADAVYDAAVTEGAHGAPELYGLSKHYKLGIASCSTCHDAHSVNSTSEGLKLPYKQLCTSCHDTVGILDNTMGDGSAHSFLDGMKGQTSILSGSYVDFEAKSDKTVLEVYTAAKSSSPYKRSGVKVSLYNPNGTKVATNLTTLVAPYLVGTWTYISTTATTAVYGTDFTFDPTGSLNFNDVGGQANFSRFQGTYTAKWTSSKDSNLTITKVFQTITP